MFKKKAKEAIKPTEGTFDMTAMMLKEIRAILPRMVKEEIVAYFEEQTHERKTEFEDLKAIFYDDIKKMNSKLKALTAAIDDTDARVRKIYNEQSHHVKQQLDPYLKKAYKTAKIFEGIIKLNEYEDY